MFLDFYSLREQPFGVTPDPRYLYLSATHREALASLLYGFDCNRGFMTLVADPGMGKTTLLFWLMQRLQGVARVAFVFDTQCDKATLLRYVLADLGIDATNADIFEMHERLNNFLVGEAKSGRRVLVIIDEAQNLNSETLESVRLLSNFETPSGKLLQIILAGQPALADKLAEPSLTQLRQRFSVMARLKPFAPAETEGYIDHRLSVSGHSNPQRLFEPAARSLIASQSGGIPRNINNLCFNALSLGFATQKRTIGASIVRTALADMDIASLGSKGHLQPEAQSGYSLSSTHETPRQTALREADDAAANSPFAGSQPTPLSSPKKAGPLRWAFRASIVLASVMLTGLLAIQVAGKHIWLAPTPSPGPAIAPAAEATGFARKPKGSSSLHGLKADGQVRTAHVERTKRVQPTLESMNVPETAANSPSGAIQANAMHRDPSPSEATIKGGFQSYRGPRYPSYVKLGTAAEVDAGTVDIHTDPAGADISIDDVEFGASPRSVKLSAGTHRLAIALPGYETFVESINVQKGRLLPINTTLSSQ